MTIELILWRDAESEDNVWVPSDEALESAQEPLPIIESVGFVFFENDDHIALIHSLDESNLCMSPAIKIPKGVIISRTILKE